MQVEQAGMKSAWTRGNPLLSLSPRLSNPEMAGQHYWRDRDRWSQQARFASHIASMTRSVDEH